MQTTYYPNEHKRPWVLAAVVGMGGTVLHATGFRAERAEIVAIKSTEFDALDNPLRAIYDVPVVYTDSQLVEKALPYGRLNAKWVDDLPITEGPKNPPISGWMPRTTFS